jgi:hypothetical protein
MRNLFIAGMLVALSACATTTPPQSLDEGLAYAESQVTGIEMSASQALQAKTLTVAQAQQVLTTSDQIVTLIGAARVAEAGGDTTTAQGKLSLATALLAQAAAYLTAHGVK